MRRPAASASPFPETAALDALALALLPRLLPLLAAQLGARNDHYVNGKAPHLPAGWTSDRFLRWCRDRQRDGAVHVERDGKLRRVRSADLDEWIASQSAAYAPPIKLTLVTTDATPANLDDEAARELGLRPRRAAR